MSDLGGDLPFKGHDPEPQPGDGPQYHDDWNAWNSRQNEAGLKSAPVKTDRDLLADDLNEWWMDTAHVEATAVVDKAVEYGANSMTELGHEIAKLSGRKVTDAEAIELACYFYIKGKLGRWSDSIVAGRPVSDDTLGDIGVYVRMAQRVRSHGGWPGQPKDATPIRPDIAKATIGTTADLFKDPTGNGEDR